MLADIDTVGIAHELADIDPLRVHHHELDDTEFLDQLASELSARGEDEPETFHAFVSVATSATEQVIHLVSTHTSMLGVAVVTAGGQPGQHDVEFRLASDGRLVAPTLGLDLTAAGLSPEEAAATAAIVALTREAAPTSPPPNRSSEPAWRAATDRAGGLIAAYADAPPAANDLQRATEVGTEPEAVEEPGPDEVIPDHVEPLDPGLDEDVAAWFDPDCRLPRVHLLGPVRASAHGNPSAVARRKPHYVELLAFLALHPEGVSTRQVAEAFSLSKERVRIDIGVVRKWLGKSQRTGQPHLPPAAQSRAAGESGVWTYQVDDVLVDADLFRRLRARGQARGDDGQTDFHAALRLVDGAPFSDLREAGWSWLLDADSRDDEILACAIVDVAHEVVAAALPDGDLGRAERAVEIARMASPYDEVARVDRAAVLVAQGHEDAAREFLSSAVYNRVDDHLGPLDVPERTAELLAKRTTDRRSNGHH